MASQFVRVSRDGGLAVVELINSKRLNIVGSAAIDELTHAFRTIGDDNDVRVVVLRGAGDTAFIGGADINEMVTLQPSTAEVFIRRLAGLCEAIRACPVPVIARLAGWCLGGGLEVAISCDLRIAEAGAKFGMPEVAVGIPSVIHSAMLPRPDRGLAFGLAVVDRRNDRRAYGRRLGAGARGPGRRGS